MPEGNERRKKVNAINIPLLKRKRKKNTKVRR